MRQTLKVQISDKKSYDIEISDSSFDKLNQQISEMTKGQKRLVVISKRVYDLYRCDLRFSEEEIFILKDGEKEKNIKNYLKIMKRAIELGLTRSDVLIAIGGGVVGDITGFVASTYMRGIVLFRFRQHFCLLWIPLWAERQRLIFRRLKILLALFISQKPCLSI